jgi:hypothetical protein
LADLYVNIVFIDAKPIVIINAKLRNIYYNAHIGFAAVMLCFSDRGMMIIAGHVSAGGNHALNPKHPTDPPARNSGPPRPRRYAGHPVVEA